MTNQMETIFLFHQFANQLHNLYNDDGMIRCLYAMLHSFSVDTFTSSELALLSMVQDEYQKMYDQYYEQKRVTETEGLNRLLADVNVKKIEEDEHTHPMIIAYLSFIKADRMYFIGDYTGAIQEYSNIDERIKAEHKKSELTNIDKERRAYLNNAIAWSYRLRNKEGDYIIAIETYRKMFDEIDGIDQHYFAWKYRRNYGVCLENAGRYLEAIEQYEKAIDDYMQDPDSRNNNEYKIFITYCSAMMKYWDQKTGKLTGEWIKNISELYNNSDKYLTDDTFVTIEARLQLANLKARDIDLGNMLPDYYNQRTKMLIYKMIVSSENNDKKKYEKEIKKNIAILGNVSPNAYGWRYIKRDFYYALYELASNPAIKEEYFNKAWSENEFLAGRGDAKEYTIMLERKKNCNS